MNELSRRALIYGGAVAGAYGLLAGVQRVCLTAFADDDAKDDGRPVKIVKFADDGKRLGTFAVPRVVKTAEEWKKQLGELEFEVTRRGDTEKPFTGALYEQHAPGLYRCGDCGNALFDGRTKFDSGTGWPSFREAIARENVRETRDASFGMMRTEVRCTLCNAHLGHVFTDGPKPTGLRYCINSAALRFIPRQQA